MKRTMTVNDVASILWLSREQVEEFADDAMAGSWWAKPRLFHADDVREIIDVASRTTVLRHDLLAGRPHLR